MNARIIAVAGLLLVITAGWLLQGRAAQDRPFTLEGFVRYVDENRLYTEPSESIRSHAPPAGRGPIRFNTVPDFTGTDMSLTALFVDVQALLDSRKTPRSFRDYAKAYLHNSGRAFACHQFLIVDGSLKDRSFADLAERMTSIPAGHFADDIKAQSGELPLEFVFHHELAHLIFFHLEPGEEASAAFNAGNEAMNTGNAELARQSFLSVAKACPAHYKALDHLAIVERRAGNNDAAIGYYKRSLAINPANEIGAKNIIVAMVMSGRFDEARTQLARNAAVFPDSPEIPYWRGMIALFEEKPGDAFDAFGTARDLYHAQEDARAIESSLYQLGLAETFGQESSERALLTLEEDCAKFGLEPGPFQSLCRDTPEKRKAFSRALLLQALSHGRAVRD